MEVVRTVVEMQERAEAARCAGHRLALVPTMGALHEGHLELVREARRRADHVTVSIFVNPTQFAPGEDFDRYPRTPEEDLARLAEVGGVDVVFLPETSDIYPPGARTKVLVSGLDEHLCGAFRAGHFVGVTTVVARLFTACRPHVAVFGRKDAQQFVILRRMVDDLGFGVEMVGFDTIRESDGLAMSSRNRYLDPESRRQAVVLSEAVFAARAAIEGGERDADAVRALMRGMIEGASRARFQYGEVVDAESLQPVDVLKSQSEVLVAVAVYFGDTRLIDNQFVRVP